MLNLIVFPMALLAMSVIVLVVKSLTADEIRLLTTFIPALITGVTVHITAQPPYHDFAVPIFWLAVVPMAGIGWIVGLAIVRSRDRIDPE